MKKKFPYILGATVSLLFLITLSVFTFIFVCNLKSNITTPPTDTVYVYVNAENESESETEGSYISWIVKEHNEKIGVFDSNGSLIKLIDIYVKALPKSDQAALREGILINSDKELYSIIEAYSD